MGFNVSFTGSKLEFHRRKSELVKGEEKQLLFLFSPRKNFILPAMPLGAVGRGVLEGTEGLSALYIGRVNPYFQSSFFSRKEKKAHPSIRSVSLSMLNDEQLKIS